MTNYNPNIDPANNGTLVGTIKFAYEQMMKNTDGMLPAKVLSYNRETNRVKVQLLITLVTTGGEQVPRPTVASLPVLQIGGGGFTLNFPLTGGDLGWVMASDRDISLFLQTYAQAQPNTQRVKNFSDGLFIPNVMTQYSIDEEDEDCVVLQSLDGTTKISIGDLELNIKSPLKIILDAPLIVANPITPGLFAVNGAITASGTITPGTPIPP